jgi:transposase InsO family protein
MAIGESPVNWLIVVLIHHSDRGGQYADNRFRQILKRSSIRQSMSRAGLLRQRIHGKLLRNDQDGTGDDRIRDNV